VTTLKATSSLLVLLMLAGCFPVRYVPTYPAIPLPEQPYLLSVKAQELECVAPEAYRRLLLREEALRGHIRELRALITEHNEGVPK
jgi:hypothetical protein